MLKLQRVKLNCHINNKAQDDQNGEKSQIGNNFKKAVIINFVPLDPYKNNTNTNTQW